MDVPLYSVKVNSQVGNIWICVMTTQKGESPRILNLMSQKIYAFYGKFSRWPLAL